MEGSTTSLTRSQQRNLVMCNSKLRSTKLKVKIVGDSHFKVATTRINQYLNIKFKVSNLIKPGVCVSQLVHSQENELKCLGKNDGYIY
jgi:hypothetical protein